MKPVVFVPDSISLDLGCYCHVSFGLIIVRHSLF
uniref:Uncharacterized protein n=1 Tax=Arundo donax TaxID=35708 RepID=A0A0A9TUE0_ARUDO